jgi:hypothetical protein
VTTQEGCFWTAFTSNAWIHINSSRTNVGSGNVIYSVDPNSSISSRSGGIHIDGQNFFVGQAGNSNAPPPCTFALSPSDAGYGSGGGTGVISVTTQDGCFWTAFTSNAWIHINSSRTNVGSGNVIYSVDPNSSVSSRSGGIHIDRQNFFVSQAGNSNAPPPCTFALFPSNSVYRADGGTGMVSVTTQDGCFWTAFTSNAWIHTSSSPTNVGSGSVNYSVDANDAFSSRLGSIRIAGRIFFVSQSGNSNAPPPCTFALSPSEAAYGAGAGTGVVSVTTQDGCFWTASTTNFWVHINSSRTNLGSGNVLYSVEPNPTVSSRSGGIHIDGQNFFVSQAGNSNAPPPCTFALSPSDAGYGSGGGTGVVSVSTQDGCFWTVSTSNLWIHINSSRTNAGSGSVIYSVEPNSSVSSRSGGIHIDGQNFFVSQAGNSNAPPPCTFALSPTEAAYGAQGGTGVVSVATQDGCLWAAFTTNGWIHILSSPTNVGSGHLVYSVEPTRIVGTRSGAIHIDGQNFLVTQDGSSNAPPPCTFALSPSNAVYSADGGTGVVSVTTQDGCFWSVFTSNAWIHISSSRTNVGSGNVLYFVEHNASPSARDGIIHIDGRNFYVNQAGEPSTNGCLVSISPTGRVHSAASETAIINVTVPPGCSWGYVNTNHWISTLPFIGAGDGALQYTVEANPSTFTRTGVISISGLAYVVTQLGNTNVEPGCTFALSPSNAVYRADGGTGAVAVATQDGCAWNAFTSNAWLHITSPASNLGSGTVTYFVNANSSSFPRTGFIRIDGRTFYVSQAGADTNRMFIIMAASATLSVYGSTSQTNVLECSEDLISWVPISTNVAPCTIVDRTSTNAPNRFYRTRELP